MKKTNAFLGLDWRDILERVLWTWLMGVFGAYSALQATGGLKADKKTLVALLAGGFGALLSLAKNVIKQKSAQT